MNKSAINQSESRDQEQKPDPHQSHEPSGTVPTRKHHHVDPPSPGPNAAHTSFTGREEGKERLDARESLDIPLVSFQSSEVEEEEVVPPPEPIIPGIDRRVGMPSMPDSEHVSALPEGRTEKYFMVQEAHNSAGPHVIIDTPLPGESPSVDLLPRSLQPGGTLQEEMDELADEDVFSDVEDATALEAVAVERIAVETVAAKTLLEVTGLTKSYRKASIKIPVLRGVDLTVKSGQFVSVVGQSGSGKSTLLHLLATLDSPDDGQIRFHGYRIDNLPSRRRDLLRNDRFGMIFQFYHLLPELNVLENVLSPLLIRESVLGYLLRRRAHRRRAIELIEAVGLGHRLKHRPCELSGGEMQRTAIARALISQPELLFADEPTGNLDQETGAEIMELLTRLNREQNLTIVMVTHDQDLAATADQTIGLVDGRIV